MNSWVRTIVMVCMALIFGILCVLAGYMEHHPGYGIMVGAMIWGFLFGIDMLADAIQWNFHIHMSQDVSPRLIAEHIRDADRRHVTR